MTEFPNDFDGSEILQFDFATMNIFGTCLVQNELVCLTATLQYDLASLMYMEHGGCECF